MAEDIQREIIGIINEIAKNSSDGNYIYRGEPKCHKTVSSSLWRLLQKGDGIGMTIPDIKDVREMFLEDARRYARDTDIDDFELEAQLQHNGGKTSLIDFTTDYLIALFFACDGKPGEDGRVILLKQDETTKDWIEKPKNPEHRVIAQKSIFVQPPEGFIERCKYGEPIKIRKDLKPPLLDYLRKYHGIFPQSIYNDLQGYIKHQKKHHEAYNNLRKGMYCDIEAFFASGTDKYDEAIESYSKAIVLHPAFAQAYYVRGVAYSNKGDFERAVEDLTKAIELDPDSIESYTERAINRILIGEYDGAISDYNWLISHSPDKVRAYCNRGDAYRRRGDFDLALEDCNAAIELNPLYNYPYRIRGNIYYDQNEYEKAIEDFTKAIDSLADENFPDKPIAYESRSKVYRAMGEEACANADFAKAEELRNARIERERRHQRSLGRT